MCVLLAAGRHSWTFHASYVLDHVVCVLVLPVSNTHTHTADSCTTFLRAQYVRHFPAGVKYVSLLRQADTPEAQAELESKRAKLRGMVAQGLAQVCVCVCHVCVCVCAMSAMCVCAMCVCVC